MYATFAACRLDYCGIAILIVGSKIPFIYYTFYCDLLPKVIYLTFTATFGTACVVVSLWDKFATPKYRPLRAGTYSTSYTCALPI